MGIVSHIIKKINAVEITAAEYPALINAVEELAVKAGFVETPKLHIIKHAMIGSKPIAGALGPKDMIFTPALLERLDSSKSIVSEEMKAVIGHEMSHMKHNLRDIGCTRLPLLLAPVAVTLGYHFYRKANKGSNNPQEFHERLDAIAEKERQGVKASPADKAGVPKEIKTTADDVITVAKYAAVGIAGLGAGALASRQFSRAFEYAADRYGAKLVSAEAMGNALKKVHGDFEESMCRNPKKQSIIMKFFSETILAHPSLEERLTNLSR